MPDISFTSRRDGPVGLLTLHGEARLEHVAPWQDAGTALLAKGAKHLLVDVRGLTFTDSASMGGLIHLQSRYEDAGGRVILVGPPGFLTRLISAMGLSGRIRTAPDEVSARTQLIR